LDFWFENEPSGNPVCSAHGKARSAGRQNPKKKKNRFFNIFLHGRRKPFFQHFFARPSKTKTTEQNKAMADARSVGKLIN
jgi:hypothetical protein